MWTLQVCAHRNPDRSEFSLALSQFFQKYPYVCSSLSSRHWPFWTFYETCRKSMLTISMLQCVIPAYESITMSLISLCTHKFVSKICEKKVFTTKSKIISKCTKYLGPTETVPVTAFVPFLFFLRVKAKLFVIC